MFLHYAGYLFTIVVLNFENLSDGINLLSAFIAEL